MRSVLVLALLGACGFSVPATEPDAPVDVPPDVPAPITWAVDTTSGKAVPANVVEWRDFLKAKGLTSIMPPSGLWLAQEAAGPLVDSIGTVVLMPFGPPTYFPLFSQSIPGWTRHAVGMTDGTFAGFTNQSDPGLPNVSTTAMTVLALVSVSSSGGPRTFLVEGSSSLSSYARVDLEATKRLTIAIDTAATSGTLDHGASPFALLMKVDDPHSQQKLITKTETITLPFTQLGSARGLFLGGANFPAPEARFLYVVAWYGTKAEISDADATALLTALDW